MIQYTPIARTQIEDLKLLTPDNYEFTIYKAEEKVLPWNKEPVVELSLKIVDKSNKTHFVNPNLTANDLEGLLNFYLCIGHEEWYDGSLDPNRLVGCTGVAKIGKRDSGVTKDGKPYKAKNIVSSWLNNIVVKPIQPQKDDSFTDDNIPF